MTESATEALKSLTTGLFVGLGYSTESDIGISRGRELADCFPKPNEAILTSNNSRLLKKASFCSMALNFPNISCILATLLVNLLYRMSTKKAGGTAKNLRDSQPKYLGVKRADGQEIKTGQIIVRQRGTKIEAGKNVKVSKDHTLFAMADGVVSFRNMRKTKFNGHVVTKKAADVVVSA